MLIGTYILFEFELIFDILKHDCINKSYSLVQLKFNTSLGIGQNKKVLHLPF
jgi:hypothetical protein